MRTSKNLCVDYSCILKSDYVLGGRRAGGFAKLTYIIIGFKYHVAVLRHLLIEDYYSGVSKYSFIRRKQ